MLLYVRCHHTLSFRHAAILAASQPSVARDKGGRLSELRCHSIIPLRSLRLALSHRMDVWTWIPGLYDYIDTEAPKVHTRDFSASTAQTQTTLDSASTSTLPSTSIATSLPDSESESENSGISTPSPIGPTMHHKQSHSHADSDGEIERVLSRAKRQPPSALVLAPPVAPYSSRYTPAPATPLLEYGTRLSLLDVLSLEQDARASFRPNNAGASFEGERSRELRGSFSGHGQRMPNADRPRDESPSGGARIMDVEELEAKHRSGINK